MADTYDYLGATGTEELIGGGQTQPIRMVSARAKPSGATFTVPVALPDFTPERLGIILGTIAAALNKAADVHGVVDIDVYQDVTSSGQFSSQLAVGVQSDSGRTSETINPPYGSIFDASFAEAVDKAVSNMNAIEAA